MKVDKKETYTILGDEEDKIENFASFLEFIIPKAYAEENLIIDLQKYEEFNLHDLLCFLEISNKQRAAKKSFVIVNKAINSDIVPEEILVAPTLQEAQDIIDLEEIQRDLGF